MPNNDQIGNEDTLAQVREAMTMQEKIRLGGDLQEGIPINYTSMFGNEYKGTVVFKRPTMQEYLRMGAIKSEYLRLAGVQNIRLVDDTVKYIAHCIAVLSVVLVKRPEWLLKLEDIQESDVLYHIHEKFEEWEDSFRKPVPNLPEADSATSEGTKAMDTP